MPDSAQTANVNPMSGPGDSRPVPDPTLLTGQMIAREVQMLRELLETRLDAMDRAMIVFNDNITRVPTDVDKQVGHLKELHEEKFAGVQKQFSERDVRVESSSRDNKVAIDAALQAAKEAVGQQTQASDRAIAKSEAGTTKQMDQLGVQIQTETKALDGKIGDLKERLTLIEGRGSGIASSWAVGAALIGMALGVVGLVFAALR